MAPRGALLSPTRCSLGSIALWRQRPFNSMDEVNDDRSAMTEYSWRRQSRHETAARLVLLVLL